MTTEQDKITQKQKTQQERETLTHTNAHTHTHTRTRTHAHTYTGTHAFKALFQIRKRPYFCERLLILHISAFQ